MALNLFTASAGMLAFENMITTNSSLEDRTPPNPKTDFIPLGMTKSSWVGMYGLPTDSGT